ncbi:TPA: zinc metalloprotease [Elizabethkingia meningoseptica]|uniref:zinc metalloprotease n=1 Tax=Elizabethkingia meningoseptica TaxID=238 RepID=UPI0022F1C8F8|nr:zinc metalloprotease [Elizabethkingia meningoseptica]EJK5330593.1 zinc metalloprotease [Elizabethkingia meningoseptica]WBS76079.1 zinc metalloprotease [Elizabethkingia meningoseptica]HAY3564169.1 zinc metalloprotease [Elizabethkingia meningoseptica]
MKKLFLGVAVLSMLASCKNEAESEVSANNENLITNASADANKRFCPSEEIRQELLKTDANALRRYNEIEALSVKFEKQTSTSRQLGNMAVLPDGTVEIPVVFNVIYKTAADNLSDAVLQEQIDILNKDYSATNSDINKIPSEFLPVAAGDVKVKFKLAGVNRKQSNKNSWSYTNDAMKKASSGGIDATNPSKNLNFWVVNTMPSPQGEILGYATFPESAGLWNDGVVLGRRYVGKTGASAPFNLGRTATHEIGHYLNLRHIWGDGSGCATDYCDDTPVQPSASTGDPVYPKYGTCGGVKRSLMFMNYMDYSNDASLYMFSANQKTRMQATTSATGPRAGLRS